MIAQSVTDVLPRWIELRHMSCVECGRHVAVTVFLDGDGRVEDSWGGVLFKHPGFVCDCCVKECPTCRETTHEGVQ